MERSKEYDRQKYQTKKEVYRERNMRYRENNPERMAQYKKDWQEANRERYVDQKRKNQSARRARHAGQTSALIPLDLLEARISYYGGKCWICKTAPYEEIDHVKPISKGGSHMLSNLRPACKPCNRSKSAKWPFLIR